MLIDLYLDAEAGWLNPDMTESSDIERANVFPVSKDVNVPRTNEAKPMLAMNGA